MRHLAFFLTMLIASSACAVPVRVYKHPDGTISIDYPTDQYVGTPAHLQGLPMVEVDSSQLPPNRKVITRSKWRLNGANQVFEDATIVSPEEVRKQRRDSAKSKLRVLGLSNDEVQALTND